MPFQDQLRRWAQRILLSLGTAVAVSVTAMVCAWLDFRRQDLGQPTLWEFATIPDTVGVRMTCFLAGMLTFPICLISSVGWDGTRTSLVKVLRANAVTMIFAILAAVAMASLHYIPAVDHH